MLVDLDVAPGVKLLQQGLGLTVPYLELLIIDQLRLGLSQLGQLGLDVGFMLLLGKLLSRDLLLGAAALAAVLQHISPDSMRAYDNG